jgi:ABC-2 type transport system permease protein
MMRNIFILTLNDLGIAYKNKTIFLIVFIPIFVFFSLQLIDKEPAAINALGIGLVEGEIYNPDFLTAINSADVIFNTTFAPDKGTGQTWITEKKIHGLLLPSKLDEQKLVLIVAEKGSLQTLAMVEGLSALQRAVEGYPSNWLSEIEPLQRGGVQKQTLPTWILMLVLLVGFIIMPAQVAEEKEKKLLLALLQTPMREIDWLLAKLLSGMILTMTAASILHLLGGFEPGNILSYIAFLAVGSFCFSSYGILLGFLCGTQASARTLGVLFYLPHLLPSALSDFSLQLTSVAPFLPSYQLYQPIKAILLDEGILYNWAFEWTYLLVFGLSTLFLSYMLIKRRWLMA